MKIVFTDCKTMNPGDICWDDFFDPSEIVLYDHTSPEQLLDRVSEAEIIVANKTILGKELISSCKKLKCICVSATGYNNVDTEYAASLNIPVLNAANYSDASVAQHVLAMLLNVYNKTSYYNETVHIGRWINSRDFTYYDEPIEEISSKTIGFIGFGNLGRATAKLFLAFGAQIKVLEYPHRKLELDDDRFEVLNEEDFFKTCDVITIHTPLNENTQGMVDQHFLSKMKSNAILINTSRGGVVHEQALAEALKSKVIKAACLDVLTTEPPKDSPLFGIRNCFITPHQAWASKQARMRLMRIVSDNIKAFKRGELKNQVN